MLCNKRTQECELCFNYGEKIPVKKIKRGFGGSALNCAIGFANLSLETTIATIVGDDKDGREAVDFLRDNKVATDPVIREGNTNQSAIILYKKERTVLSYHDQRDYQKLKLAPSDWIYFASAGRGSERLVDNIARLHERGARVCFNPGNWELINFKSFTKIAKISETFVLNKTEADQIIGVMKTKSQLKAINEMGAKIAVITDGANGAYFSHDSSFFHMGILPSRVVDPTGAGDSFSSGFVGALALGVEAEAAIKWGMANSSSVISETGANRGLLTIKNIGEVLEKAISLKPSKI